MASTSIFRTPTSCCSYPGLKAERYSAVVRCGIVGRAGYSTSDRDMRPSRSSAIRRFSGSSPMGSAGRSSRAIQKLQASMVAYTSRSHWKRCVSHDLPRMSPHSERVCRHSTCVVLPLYCSGSSRTPDRGHWWWRLDTVRPMFMSRSGD